jgi:hypothetical protein
MRDVETMWNENPYLHSENPLHIVFVAINQKVMPRDSDSPAPVPYPPYGR